MPAANSRHPLSNYCCHRSRSRDAGAVSACYISRENEHSCTCSGDRVTLRRRTFVRSWNSPGITWSYVLWCDTTNAWSWGRKLATESVNASAALRGAGVLDRGFREDTGDVVEAQAAQLPPGAPNEELEAQSGPPVSGPPARAGMTTYARIDEVAGPLRTRDRSGGQNARGEEPEVDEQWRVLKCSDWSVDFAARDVVGVERRAGEWGVGGSKVAGEREGEGEQYAAPLRAVAVQEIDQRPVRVLVGY
ncbi:hypothetical protein B0H15DRAFT_973308 [Mycena belliarum]|uniref:Uncharacterized protein n=1 Tax=Mycena belliarum TaxID=1033014 RepID=A0AAD6U7K9_9AGAR|nr:hypothetical protein B0H15DRAFT_973308 [Mycena belliae]